MRFGTRSGVVQAIGKVPLEIFRKVSNFSSSYIDFEPRGALLLSLPPLSKGRVNTYITWSQTLYFRAYSLPASSIFSACFEHILCLPRAVPGWGAHCNPVPQGVCFSVLTGAQDQCPRGGNLDTNSQNWKRRTNMHTKRRQQAERSLN